MKKILVTTDRSENSIAAFRFAIQLAVQDSYELTFANVHDILRPTSWSDLAYQAYVTEEKERLQQDLDGFVEDTLKMIGTAPVRYKNVMLYGSGTVDTLIEYAEMYKYDYICIATRGAGAIRKWIGTTAEKLISRSPVPVLCVPDSYRQEPIETILYASDLADHEYELEQISAFAKPLSASVELLHLSFEEEEPVEVTESELEEGSGYPVKVTYKRRSPDGTLLEQINAVAEQQNPSLVVMFTRRQSSFFDRLFTPSKSAEYSFFSKRPLLVFKRT